MVVVPMIMEMDYCVRFQPTKPINNAENLLRMLGEKEADAKVKARIVKALNHWPTINHAWFSMAKYLPQLEALVEDASFANRREAALLASRIQFYLSQYDDALRYVLLAEDLFELVPMARGASTSDAEADMIAHIDDLFVSRMIEECIDQYKSLPPADRTDRQARLSSLVDRIFDRSALANNADAAYDVVALALAVRRLDVMTRVLAQANDPDLLVKAVDLAMARKERQFTGEALAELVELMFKSSRPDYVRLCQALIRLDRPHHVADLLSKLTGRDESDVLLAYQIAFEVYHTASQQFVTTIVKQLQSSDDDLKDSTADDESMMDTASAAGTKPTAAADTTAPPAAAVGTAQLKSKPSAASNKSGKQSGDDAEDKMIAEMSRTQEEQTGKLLRILSGHESIGHHLQFLIKSNKTDLVILKNCKDAVRSSIAHNATVMANGLMHFGTTCDDFLRNNLDWVSKATNWNKFNAVASLGVIHRGHESDARKLLEPYLPAGDAAADSFGFKEGGAMYALGFIFANHGNEETVSYLRGKLQAMGGADQSVNIKHGAALGLGLAALGTHDSALCAALREALFTDDAVVGEAAGVAMGMVMAGSQEASVFNEMLQYIVETQHDKIKRGLRVGLSLLMYNRRELAEPFIKQMQERDSEAALRQTVVWCLAMAYAGTGNAEVVGRLLSRVANDPNDDVKRFAATAIGFVMLNWPAECVEYAKLLVDHFNGYIRYGAAMAVGVACAGTANKEAIACLEPLLSAKESYVRQGAVIALSMIMVEHNDVSCPKMKELREKLQKMIGDKQEEAISKFGAIVAQGILDAGGRNVTISLSSAGRANSTDMCATVGMLCFLQYWYWHSMVPMISLTFRPTCTIGLNSDLKMPKMQLQCNAKWSNFAHVPPTEEKKDKQAEKVETVQLSISAKKSKRLSTTVAPLGIGDKKDEKDKTATAGKEADSKTAADETKEDDKKKEPEAMDTSSVSTQTAAAEQQPAKKEEPEPNTFTAQNPARVVPWQNAHMSLPADSPYAAVKPVNRGGFIMLSKNDPQWKAEELVVMSAAGGSRVSDSAGAAQEIKTPPPPFTIRIANYK